VAEGAPAIKQIPPTAAPPPSPVDQPAKPSPAPAPTKIAAAEASAAVAAGTSFASADEPAKAPVSIPIPVLFVYNEAAFTEEGRRAAGLLLEYLKVKRLDAVTLSGHADERGSPSFNLDLSRERLATVASFLKSGGYAGALRLEPRGESEPFVGIDRTRFNREELYQLDRRVELRLVN
jgi:outer membrane protein OmpA-like peptidoglycan-associated protein